MEKRVEEGEKKKKKEMQRQEEEHTHIHTHMVEVLRTAKRTLRAIFSNYLVPVHIATRNRIC